MDSSVPTVEAPEQSPPTPPQPVAENGFRKLGLRDDLVSAVEKSGYTTPTPIQARTIPHLLKGRDVLGQAQTGTGKTAAFALPMLQRIEVSKRQPQVLVLAPTRELAIQVAEAFEKYAGQMKGLRVVPIYGGQDYQIQFGQLRRGVHVVVGTPGRVMDHMRRGSLDLRELQCLILDEADEMLRMGFADDVDWVLTQTPDHRQMALFSATMPKQIRQIAQHHLKKPAEVTIAQRTTTAETINQRYIVASPHIKRPALVRILEAEATDGVLVFVKTRSTTEPLAEYLAAAGFRTAALNGDIAQKQRERIVDGLRRGRTDIIVATDVAARGLDVQRISHVINYDLPHDSEAYVHRIGRTGRAGRSGEAILFVHPRERRFLKRLEQTTRQPIEPMELPSNRAVNKQRVARFHERITKAIGNEELETFQAIIEHYQRENDVPLELIAASLAYLANGEAPILLKNDAKQELLAPQSHRDKGRKRGAKQGPSNDKRAFRRDAEEMNTFRIDVGRNHQVNPGNIVGAIANEAGIGSESIGKIKIYDQYSTVDLPRDVSSKTLNMLQSVTVSGRKLQITRFDNSEAPPSRFQDGEKSHSRAKPKSPKVKNSKYKNSKSKGFKSKSKKRKRSASE
ncbi:MAG: DEAD/DEAH box helicase [Planctomycetaceae bacterium]|nr:DEAD/DEAH box helicase [Planctomycetaceae bacterium]